jgi:hypothetical protein
VRVLGRREAERWSSPGQEGFDLDDLTRLLSSGINVVTTRSEFFYTIFDLPPIVSRFGSR